MLYFTEPSDVVLQEERLAKLMAKTGGGVIKRKKTTEEVDKRPMPPRVSNEHRIHELLRNMYGDRTFLDDVIREAGTTLLSHLFGILGRIACTQCTDATYCREFNLGQLYLFISFKKIQPRTICS